MILLNFVGVKSMEGLGIEDCKFIVNAKRIFETDNLKVNINVNQILYILAQDV